MKKILCSLLILFTITQAHAQIQQGIVKTRGRVVNGQVVPGTRLNGAAITLNIGNPLVSGDDGAFSFNVPTGKNYSLVTAKKQGYTLADPEYIHRTFAYSASNPFYVVLEDEAQRQADINAATRKVRRTLTAQLQAREDEIEALKEQNKLTEAEYQKRLQELYDNQSKSEQLVKEMAERYASTDYDQLDEFNRQVQMYIEEGELQKADSMIRSKGDIEKRVEEYHNVVAANQKTRIELENSEIGAGKIYDDLAQDLYRHHEIFMQEFKQDSALYCLKLRADLDTTNVMAVLNYAKLIMKQKWWEPDCEKYLHICLRLFIRNNDLQNIAATQGNLGLVYCFLQDYSQSAKYNEAALEYWEPLFEQNPSAYRENIATTQNNLGILYMYQQEFYKSLKYHKDAVDNYKQLYNENPSYYGVDYAGLQVNLGSLYQNFRDYENCEKCFKEALEIRMQLLGKDSVSYKSGLAEIQHHLGQLYKEIREYIKSEYYYKLSIENYKQSYHWNPDAYRQSLATTLNNAGTLYYILGNYDSCEKYLKEALDHKEYNFKHFPTLALFRADLALTQRNLGILYTDLNDYANSEKYYKLALENNEHLFRENPDAYRIYLTDIQNSMSYLYASQNNFVDAIIMIESAISIIPENANFYDTKGEILLMQGKKEEALEIWEKVLELNPDFLKDNPDGTELSNGLKKLGLIE